MQNDHSIWVVRLLKFSGKVFLSKKRVILRSTAVMAIQGIIALWCYKEFKPLTDTNMGNRVFTLLVSMGISATRHSSCRDSELHFHSSLQQHGGMDRNLVRGSM